MQYGYHVHTRRDSAGEQLTYPARFPCHYGSTTRARINMEMLRNAATQAHCAL